MGDTKLEKNHLPKNQNTQRKLLNYEFWINNRQSKSAKFWAQNSMSKII